MITSTENYNLENNNTFAMHVACKRYVEYTRPSDLPTLFTSQDDALRIDGTYYHIGGGSNLLFTSDYNGTILHSAIKGIKILSETPDEVIVNVGAGEVMDDFIRWACEKGLWGVENLSGIPGEVGASAVQNVGAYGTEACDAIMKVHAYDTKAKEFVVFDVDVCQYAYRDSMFKHSENRGRYIIHSVDYRLSPIPHPRLDYPAMRELLQENAETITPATVRNAVIEIRNKKLPDPAITPSAGSFFKNPVIGEEHYLKLKEARPDMPSYKVAGGYKIPAAWLIDQSGWKGYSDENVAVWHLQPLVIVNPDKMATPAEVIDLEKRIIDSVDKNFGIKLSPEVEHI